MDAKTPMFPSAFDVKAPKGAEGWESLYPYYTRFQPSRRKEDDEKFWFCNSQHWPTPLRPFDVIFLDFAIKCLGQYNSRHLLVPPRPVLEEHLERVPVVVQDLELRLRERLDVVPPSHGASVPRPRAARNAGRACPLAPGRDPRRAWAA